MRLNHNIASPFAGQVTSLAFHFYPPIPGTQGVRSLTLSSEERIFARTAPEHCAAVFASHPTYRKIYIYFARPRCISGQDCSALSSNLPVITTALYLLVQLNCCSLLAKLAGNCLRVRAHLALPLLHLPASDSDLLC